MMIFLKEKLVFLATPKTASTSIEMAFGSGCDIRLAKTPNAKHTPFRKYKRMLEPFVMTLTGDEPDTVAMIREPVAWLGSWYRYRGRDEISGTANSTAGVSFDQFVTAYLMDSPPDFAKVGSQAKFLNDKDDKLGVSYLFCYENMGGMMRFMQNRLGRSVTLGHANTSPSADISLSSDLLAELHKKNAADFELYERFRA